MITSAIAFGVVAGLAVVVVVWSWWADRPKPRNATAIRAEYERAFVEKEKGVEGERVLEMRYALRNTTKRDITLAGSAVTLYLQRDDGTLIDLKQITGSKLEDVTVPAGDTVIYLMHPKMPYKANKDCKVQPVDDPTKEQITEYLGTCYKWMRGFVLMSDSANLRIDMPFAPAKPKT